MSHETGSTFASTRVVLCGRCRLSHETWFALTACDVVLPRQMSRSRGRPASRFDMRVSGFHGATWRGRTVEVRLAQHISSEAGERACAVRRNIILYDRKVKGLPVTLAGKQSGLSHEHTLKAKNRHPGPVSLRRATQGAEMIEERDIFVAMRDGTRQALDVYRPGKAGRYPVRDAAALHNKDMQGPDVADVLPPQPAHAPLWFGPIEAGNTRLFVANGYAHVIAQPRGSGKSEGHYGHEDTDHYDTIEWITHQPWCDGNVGMVGISGYAGEQWRAAEQGHPALKAIFPYDACSAYGGRFGFRAFYPG